MTQPTPPESPNNHRSETESPSFAKRGKLWVPDTVQGRRSPLQRVWGWTGFGEKKLWDVLQLLIVPTALAIGAFYLQETAKQRDLQIAEANRQKDQKIADDREKQETLNRYFDQISTLLFERKLRTNKKGDEARIVARARTLTALRNLDGQRKGQLIKFLVEAKLLEVKEPAISLVGADLEQADLSRANLIGTSLFGANLSKANLSGAILSGANLNGADLTEANLVDAKLSTIDFRPTRLEFIKEGTSLRDLLISEEFDARQRELERSRAIVGGADLTDAKLSGAKLSGAELRGAKLIMVDLSRADLSAADLRGAELFADLREADLTAANLNSDTLNSSILCRTKIPNSTKGNRDCNELKQPK